MTEAMKTRRRVKRRAQTRAAEPMTFQWEFVYGYRSRMSNNVSRWDVGMLGCLEGDRLHVRLSNGQLVIVRAKGTPPHG